LGFECSVVIIGAPEALPESLTNELIAEWYLPVNAKVFWGLEHAPPAYISLATAWKTAYAVRNFQSTVHKCYFVQDFEPWFYPVGSEYVMAEETYRFGFTGITAGDWLASKLAEEYGMKTFSVGFSYDHDRYRPIRQQDPAVQRVFFYARPTTARRAFELGVLALNIVSKRHPNVEVIFAGGDISAYEIPFKYTDAGIADLDALPELYSRCSVALVLSFSNLSLLPLELMACGIPVVSNRAACTEWLLNDQNSLLATPTAEGLAEAVCTVLSDPSVAARLRQEGLKTAVSTDWSREAERVADVLRRLDAAITGDVQA
jgi:glycosyltransferase involved in cell wall biosynthesis